MAKKRKSPEPNAPKPDNAPSEPPSPLVGRTLLRTWATTPHAQFNKWKAAARDFASRWRAEIKEEFSESLFISAVVLPAVIGLARAGKTNQAHRLIDFASTLALREDSRSLALSKTGAPLIAEVKEGLRNYAEGVAAPPVGC